MQPWFLWKGVDSRDMDVWVSELPALTRAAERVEEIIVLGRPGSLHLKEGENVHEGYNKECVITVRADADFNTLLTWLSGSGDVIFSNEPDRVYKAYIPSEVKFTREGNTLKKSTIPFYVHPHKGQFPPEGAVSFTESGTLTNPGTVDSKPIMEVTFAGAGTVSVNGEPITFTAPTQSALDINAYEWAKTTETISAVMQTIFQVGNVDLFNRPTTATEGALYTAGWTDAEQGSTKGATVFPQSYKAGPDDGVTFVQRLILHMTPITSGGEIKTPAQMTTYVAGLLNSKTTVAEVVNADKTENSGLGLLLWAQEVMDWDTGEALAENFNTSLSQLQAGYYFDDMSDLPLPSAIRKIRDETVGEEAPVATSLTVTVDCDAQMVLDEHGLWIGKTAGHFPVLKRGSNTITLSGATVSIKPQWRWF